MALCFDLACTLAAFGCCCRALTAVVAVVALERAVGGGLLEQLLEPPAQTVLQERGRVGVQRLVVVCVAAVVVAVIVVVVAVVVAVVAPLCLALARSAAAAAVPLSLLVGLAQSAVAAVIALAAVVVAVAGSAGEFSWDERGVVVI